MRLVVATIAPNITLPIWARLFKRSVLPTVDRCIFRVGSPIHEMRELARKVLDFADLTISERFESHGHALTGLYSGVPSGADVLVLEDDCFVDCHRDYIDSIWTMLPYVGGVMGSRLAKVLTPEPERGWFLDTYGDGIYPNMMFAQVDVLREHTDMDFTSRNRGDVAQFIGEQLHAAGIHQKLFAHLPQCRLSMYCGTRQVDPDTWDGPWLHVGEMSVPPRWQSGKVAGHYEAAAAYQAALDSGEVVPGEQAERMRGFLLEHKCHRPDWYAKCLNLMRRVFATGRE